MPDEVVRLPKVSQAALGRSDREIDPPARLDLQGIHAERHRFRLTRDAFRVSTRLTATTREEVRMFTLRTERSANAFADLEAQLRALGASGDRLAEATLSLRASSKIFAAVSARLHASATRRLTRPVLKLV